MSRMLEFKGKNTERDIGREGDMKQLYRNLSCILLKIHEYIDCIVIPSFVSRS
jgi:hypothetical protein